jgi:hypothetical protein
LQRYGLRTDTPTRDRVLATLKTEVVKLLNLMTIVKNALGNLKELNEIKSC